jgi:8-oxo-(d)GTP phosphatase
MKLFVKDLPLIILSEEGFNPEQHFDTVVDARKEGMPYDYFIDNVLIKNADSELILKFYRKYKEKKNKKIRTITFLVKNYDLTLEEFKSFFKVIKAAGGVVYKGDKVLLINRFDTWDLPKGKIESKESAERGAVREVEEECNIRVIAEHKLCKTWHTYEQGGKHHLKKTTWYVMQCIDDSAMRPQQEEDITEVKWVPFDDLRKYLFDSYRSIRTVIRHYREYLDLKKMDLY